MHYIFFLFLALAATAKADYEFVVGCKELDLSPTYVEATDAIFGKSGKNKVRICTHRAVCVVMGERKKKVVKKKMISCLADPIDGFCPPPMECHYQELGITPSRMGHVARVDEISAKIEKILSRVEVTEGPIVISPVPTKE